MEKKFFIYVLCLAFVLSLTACDKFSKKEAAKPQQQTETAPSSSSQPSLVTIGNWKMSPEEFNQKLTIIKQAMPDFDDKNIESKKIVLEELIRQQLFLMDAEKKGIDKRKEISDAVEEFRKNLILQVAATDLLKDVQIAVTDEEAQKFYDDNKDKLLSPASLKVREITVEKEETAKELLEKIKQGADFAQLAKESSISESAANSGDLGFLDQPPFPEMGAEVIKLKMGENSGVFKGPKGFYIVKLEDKKGGEQIPFEKVKEPIKVQIKEEKQQKILLDYLEKLKSETKIEIKEDLLK